MPSLPTARAQQVVVTTKSNLQHEGELFSIEKYGVGATSRSAFGTGNFVVVIDDGLRRVFIAQEAIRNSDGESQRNEIEFNIPQREYNGSVGTVGQLVRLGEFNEFGHREFYIRGAKNVRHRYVQGITKITPRYCIVNVLISGENLKQWRMAVDTKTIDPDILRDLLIRQADPNNVNDLFDIADFFRQTRNFDKASQELLLILSKFPEEKERVEEERIELKQLQGRQILSDIEKRRDLGQTRLAATFAKVADSKEYADDIQVKFDELKKVAAKEQAQIETALQQISDVAAKVTDLSPEQKQAVDRFQQTLKKELTAYNIPRLDPFVNSVPDNSIPNSQKLSVGDERLVAKH